MSKLIVILKGKKGEGKTTILSNYIRHSSHQWGGVLTPIINGKRCMVHLFSQQIIEIEADPNQPEDFLPVGRYIFSKMAFETINQLIIKDLRYNPNVIIDEVGPLELDGKGFDSILNEVFETAESIFVVVRDTLVEDVKKRYRLDRWEVEEITVSDLG